MASTNCAARACLLVLGKTTSPPRVTSVTAFSSLSKPIVASETSFTMIAWQPLRASFCRALPRASWVSAAKPTTQGVSLVATVARMSGFSVNGSATSVLPASVRLILRVRGAAGR